MKVFQGLFKDCNDDTVASKKFLIQAQDAVEAQKVLDTHLKDPVLSPYMLPHSDCYVPIGVKEVAFVDGFYLL